MATPYIYNNTAIRLTGIAAGGVKSKGNSQSKSQNKGKGNDVSIAQPVVRLRSVLIGICALAVCMVGPLVLVWTQSYINQVSLRLKSKTETLNAINSEITDLKLKCGHLSADARIERIALARGFVHPELGKIEVWEVRLPQSGEGGLFAYLKQTFFGSDKSGGPL
jgi:cell division protein FtsL